jgi:hypothetical protein
MGKLKIEKVGGFAGFGLPGSKLQSSGEQAISALTPADRSSVETLFRNPKGHGTSDLAPHAFRYRITRTMGGKNETVEVSESALPDALKACVTDKLM